MRSCYFRECITKYRLNEIDLPELIAIEMQKNTFRFRMDNEVTSLVMRSMDYLEGVRNRFDEAGDALSYIYGE